MRKFQKIGNYYCAIASVRAVSKGIVKKKFTQIPRRGGKSIADDSRSIPRKVWLFSIDDPQRLVHWVDTIKMEFLFAFEAVQNTISIVRSSVTFWKHEIGDPTEKLKQYRARLVGEIDGRRSGRRAVAREWPKVSSKNRNLLEIPCFGETHVVLLPEKRQARSILSAYSESVPRITLSRQVSE